VVGPPSLQTIHKDDDDEVHDGISCSGFEFPVALPGDEESQKDDSSSIEDSQLR